ncbi:glycerate dehydrogenase, partial [Cryphonectria parasitica EP155]
QLPTATHEVIAVLETIHVPWDETTIDLGRNKTYEALVYRNTHADKDDVVGRIREASIVVGTICRLTGEVLSQAPYLKCVITHAVGTDHIDLEYCRKNNIQVMHSTNCNSETVAEHAIALYFATRRSLVKVHNTLTSSTPSHPNEWKVKGSMNAHMRDATGSPPRTCTQETAGIIGYGAVGKHIARLCSSLGMRVIISDRGTASTTSPSSTPSASSTPATSSSTTTTTTAITTTTPPRLPFEQVLKTATILFLSLPRTPSTTNLISHPQLSLLAPHTILINVSRGGIVDEPAVLHALTARTIFGYGTDVFAVEPAGSEEDSVLLGGVGERLNLVMTAHLAWLSETTIQNQVRSLGENVRAFGEG